MRKLFMLAAVALLAGATPAKPSTPVDFVRAVLPFAANNFAVIRGKQSHDRLGDTIYAVYLARLPDGVCADCTIADHFAIGKNVEYWSIGNSYTQSESDLVQPSFTPAPSAPPGMPPGAASTKPPEWSIEKTQSYVMAQLSPLLRGFHLSRITSQGIQGQTIPTFQWRNNRGVWVEAKMYPQMAAGILKVSVLVGHDLKPSLHYLRPASKAQIEQLRAAIKNVVTVGLTEAGNDFARLRGALIPEDIVGHSYEVTKSFGPMVRYCSILDIAARMEEGPPQWDLICGTYPFLNRRADLEKLVISEIETTLPKGFSGTSDQKQLPSGIGSTDYYWGNGTGLSVSIDWGYQDDTIASFQVRISHRTSNT